ncbi:MAG: DNA-processing protein DprA [Spirochaetota bacterium]
MENLFNILLLSLVSLREIKSHAADSGLSVEDVIPEIKAGRFETLEHISRVYDKSPVKTAEAIIKKCEASHVKIVIPSDKNYPFLLKEIHTPPSILYMEGSFNNERCISIVGTRKSDKTSEAVTRKIATALSEYGITVVSGMALGIDRSAHLSALKSGGATVAVLPNGIDVLYPFQNRDVFEAIKESENSCLISEFPPGVVPGQKWVFARRNRIVSGISQGVVIVKAPYKSGAMITARYALEQNRDVFACPGHAFDPGYEGCHALIKDGAVMVSSMEDIFDEISPSSLFRQERVSHPGFMEETPLPLNKISGCNLTEIEKNIISLINRDGVDIDHLIRTLNEGADRVSEVVTVLQIEGLVERVGNRVFLN